MKKADLFVGAKVYHSLLYNRGEGLIKNYRLKDNLGMATSNKYLVWWEDGTKTWCRASELRKTPKKARWGWER